MTLERAVTVEQRTCFDRDGYLILPGFAAALPEFAALCDEVGHFGRGFATDFDLQTGDWLAGLDEEALGTFYRGLRYLPSLTRLAASDVLAALARQLGLAFPAVMHCYNLRMDRPQADRHLFHWHQDSTYLLGSYNALTVWIPLGRVGPGLGSIEIVPGSHRGGLRPFKATGTEVPRKNAALSPADLTLEEEPAGGVVVEAEAGDAVVFSQMLLHRSTPNRSGRIRWTVQARFADLDESGFRAAGFPMGDVTTIFRSPYLTEAGADHDL